VALSRGDRLGPYHIVSPVGAGGFGEVYEARDTRLDRTVAIKVLPSTAPELKARFEREAKAIAALQHPHICTLHDIGHVGLFQISVRIRGLNIDQTFWFDLYNAGAGQDPVLRIPSSSHEVVS
jgi:serine/threonine protein kinase